MGWGRSGRGLILRLAVGPTFTDVQCDATAIPCLDYIFMSYLVVVVVVVSTVVVVGTDFV